MTDLSALAADLRNMKLAEVRLPEIPIGPQRPSPELPAGPSDEYTAADASRSLRVTVDPEGMVLRFEVAGSWLSRLPAAEFGSALMAAYQDALWIAAAVGREARRNRPEQEAPVSFENWSGAEDLETFLAKTKAEQAAIGQRLSDARENAARVSYDVTELRSPYGFVTLQVRTGALVGLTANTDTISRANPGQVQQDLWEVFGDAGLRSNRASAPVSKPSRRRPQVEEDPEEDLWKGLGRK
ncbi:hypothetical protein [Lentzea aerocolonigenes]|uniref:hypothetical protein n=1 Tax=Lentzea aerocolonigenes TaxID=68170 RepID=UPI000A613F41|nr:hypothetical protein [Lentzea aerocolonigenes]MCP2246356.1 hypothetical protein [Lentzea aerocolonigenes]